MSVVFVITFIVMTDIILAILRGDTASMLTLKVLVVTIDALGHFET